MKCKPTSCFDLAPIPKLLHYYSDIARPKIIHNVNILSSKELQRRDRQPGTYLCSDLIS